MTKFDLKFADVQPVLDQEKNVTVRHNMDYVPRPGDRMRVLDENGEHHATVDVRVVAQTKLSDAYKTAHALGKYTKDNRGDWLDRMNSYYGGLAMGADVYVIQFHL